MSSAWIARRSRASRSTSYRVMYRVGGREASPRYGGSFRTMREARIRRDWIAGELAALRVPDLRRLAEAGRAPTLAEAAKRWQASRVDVSAATVTYHRSALRRADSLLNRRIDEIDAHDVAALVATLVEAGKSRETIRKTVTVLAMVFDYAAIAPNPARDRLRVKLPREERIPVFSPHDLRHRRISLLHLAGLPWARIGEQVGQRDLAVTANTYTHVLTDETEINYAELLADVRAVQTPVQTST
jgi:integrase